VKIEQALAHYLLRNKSLSLQGIGTFHLDASVPDTADTERPVIFPENAVSFHYDPRTREDEGLVDFIVEYTHKIKPLASSDLESFLSLGRQFLNIGNPLVLQNIGTLDKTNSGELVFKAGHSVAEKLAPQKMKNDGPEPEAGEENFFNEYQQERHRKSGPRLLLVFLILLVLGFMGWSVWHYLGNRKENPENVTSTESVVPVSDTSRFKKDSTIIANAAADSNLSKKTSSDTVNFKIVVKQYRTPEAAERRLKELQNYHRNVIMYTDDSVTYKIAEPFNLPLSDSTKILDSLKRYYSKVYLER